MADLPFGSDHSGVDDALRSAVRLMQTGAQMVKLEGGGWTTPLVAAMVERGIPVCGHLGQIPQSVHALGGWRVQGRDAPGAGQLRADARALVQAGAAMIVLEPVPSALATELATELPVPLMGIGAGPGTAGQVLVLHDMLGLRPGMPARFVRNFMAEGGAIADAVARSVAAVKDGSVPDPVLHGY